MKYDLVILGSGIVGMSLAYAYNKENPESDILIIEREKFFGKHQSGNNSGVVHSGIYYERNSLKAKLCNEGRILLKQFCLKYGIDYDECGKFIVAKSKSELFELRRLQKNAVFNGLDRPEFFNRNELSNIFGRSVGYAGIFIKETSQVSYLDVMKELYKILTNTRKVHFIFEETITKKCGDILYTNDRVYEFDSLAVCAGIEGIDLMNSLEGVSDSDIIVPFLGQYFQTKQLHENDTKILIYPVPDKRYPFLGRHTTFNKGNLEIGPNARLLFSKKTSGMIRFNLSTFFDIVTTLNFWNFVRKNCIAYLRFIINNFDSTTFGLRNGPLVREGLRAQVLHYDGTLADDFIIRKYDKVIYVVNVPSPAATSSLALGKYLFKELKNK